MISIAPRRQLQIISGRSHPGLSEAVAQKLKTGLCAISLSNFANGEISCRLGESVRGKDVFVVQTHSDNVNDSIMEQAIIIDAARRSSAASVTAVCPFLGYARQDRKSNGREPITSKMIVNFLSMAGADRIMSIDLHAGQIQGFFDGPFDHIVAMPLLANYVKEKFNPDDLVIVSPDAGRAKSAERYSSLLGCSMAIVHKQRSYVQHNTVEAKYLIGDVEGKTCVVIDDMIDTAGTICAAAELLKENGATEIYGLATHGVLSDPAITRIEASPFKKIIITDTLPFVKTSKKIESVSVAPLLADAINAVFCGNSLSALFDGNNQS